LSHEVSDGGEDVLLVDSDLARLLDIEEELGIGVGVDVSVGVGVEEGTKLGGVGEVSVLAGDESKEAIETRAFGSAAEAGWTRGEKGPDAHVSHDDSVRSVDVERLSLSVGRGTGGRISD
jgi:hypothetical protein